MNYKDLPDYRPVIEELEGNLQEPQENWRWVSFPDEEKAKRFVEWLKMNGYETSGVYSSYFLRLKFPAVRFRPW